MKKRKMRAEIREHRRHIAKLMRRLNEANRENANLRNENMRLENTIGDFALTIGRVTEKVEQLTVELDLEQWVNEMWEKQSDDVSKLCDKKTQTIMGLTNQVKRWAERAKKAEAK